MKKTIQTFICQSCGQIHSKWQGRCDGCGEWNTIQEEVRIQNKGSSNSNNKKGSLKTTGLLTATEEVSYRKSSNISEFDRVLGGGFVPGSVILLGGEPGIGKSTLILQVIDKLSSEDFKCLYVSGEESIGQISSRAKRLNISNPHIELSNSCNVEDILSHIERNQLDFLVIDSLQTLYSEDISSAPGTVSQLKNSAFRIIEIAKRKDITVVFIGHITKEGQIAGPKVLEHMVDTVFYFEPERSGNLRIIRSYKNRFGSAHEIGIFEMDSYGLTPITNPSQIFLSNSADNEVSGVSIFAGIEGSRPVLFEIQALVIPTFMASPRRAVVGWDLNRLSMIIALLGARLNIKLHDKEVYLNVAGGMKLDDPAADLAVAAALVSAAWNRKIPKNAVFCGEVALSGEVREPKMLTSRLKESANLGFSTMISNFNSSKTKTKESKAQQEDVSIQRFEVDHIFKLVKYLNSINN